MFRFVHRGLRAPIVRFHGVVTRVLRTTLPDGHFHVFSRGVDGCDIFLDNTDRRWFLAHLWRCVERFDWTIHALCLMTTHYHLVLHSTRLELSRGLQRLNGRYAQEFNERHGRFGHLFSGRFASRVIADEQYLADACRYVVENPVRAGLCESAEDWPWARLRDDLYGPGLRETYQPISISYGEAGAGPRILTRSSSENPPRSSRRSMSTRSRVTSNVISTRSFASR